MTNDARSPSACGINTYKFWQCSGMGLPVKVELLALEISRPQPDPIAIVKGVDLSGIDGMLHKRKKKGDWCILYDVTVESEGRINFTKAHELGHYLLHRQQQDDFKCGESELLDYESKDSRLRESEANQFASFLLMPADDFRSQVTGISMNIDVLKHCANRYDVSLTAAILRWLDLTSEAALIAVARDDFICWSYLSRTARKLNAYLKPGTPVHEQALDRIRIATHYDIRTSKISPGVWHPNLESEEFIILSDRYELVIFLVIFPEAVIIEHEDESVLDCVDIFEKNLKD